MIIATFYYSNKGYCKGFKVDGHAKFAEYGHDLVCCAVSVSVQMCCNAITQVAKKQAKVESSEGRVEFEVCDEVCDNEIVQIILKSLELQLTVVSDQYRKNLKVCRVEV